jgi:hypothetical protein
MKDIFWSVYIYTIFLRDFDRDSFPEVLFKYPGFMLPYKTAVYKILLVLSTADLMIRKC